MNRSIPGLQATDIQGEEARGVGRKGEVPPDMHGTIALAAQCGGQTGMVAIVLSMLLTGDVVAEPGPAPIGSYLYQPCYELDDKLRGPARPYWPQPGDIMLATDDNYFWTITHWLAGAGQPHNSGIVVARPDGSLGLLEAGPNDTLHVRILDLLPHLTEYSQKGPVWLRHRTIPLTAEQSARLTAFAQAQDGKRFALIRLAGQLTPFRSRGPLRTYFLGKPHGNRCSYFCSELVTEACVAAGLLDPATARPAATYPHELFFDRSLNLYLNQHFRLAPAWDPPARWMPAVPPEDLQGTPFPSVAHRE